MKKFFSILLVAILSGALLTACNGGNHAVNEDMNGQIISVKAGETLTVKLDGNPTTGYSWQLADMNDAILKQAGDPDYKADSLLVGSGGTYTYHFTAMSAGTVVLKFNYLRIWEKDVTPYRTFTITVEVK